VSFILDALKKSESERQRQAGPALMEVRIAPPRHRLPLWATLVGALLLLNILVLAAVLLFRERPAPPSAALPVNAPASLPQRVPSATPAAATAPPAVNPAEIQPLPGAVLPATPLPSGPAIPPSANPADYLPALPAGSSPLPAREAPEDANLPTRDDMVAAGQQLPEVRLSLHVFDPAPANRYVLLNSSRLREGDSMADGLKLERITESGVILAWRGQRFRLQRGE
jgi:general secretion pathway protein B